MLTLHHFGSAISAQRVRLVLAEKGLEFESCNPLGQLRSREFLEISPNGVVPVLIHDGRALIEARIINEYLEETFREPPLMPCDSYERYRARYWSKQADEGLYTSVSTWGFVAYMRERVLAMPEAKRSQVLPLNDQSRRDRIEDALREGFRSGHVINAASVLRRVFDEMDRALKTEGPWLAGATYSLADADVTPYLHRLALMGLDFLWQERPAVIEWFDRARSRLSYRVAITDWRVSAEAQVDEAVRAQSRPIFERMLACPS